MIAPLLCGMALGIITLRVATQTRQRHNISVAQAEKSALLAHSDYWLLRRRELWQQASSPAEGPTRAVGEAALA